MTSIFEGRHIDLRKATHRSSKVDASIFEDRRRKHHTYNSSSNIVHNCAPKSLEWTKLHTLIRIYMYKNKQYLIYGNSNTRVTPHVHYSYVLNAYLYCVYALVGGVISIRDPYICPVSRVCANESDAVFHGPVVCAVKT